MDILHFLYPGISQGEFIFLPPVGYCEYCHSDTEGYQLYFFLRMELLLGILEIIWSNSDVLHIRKLRFQNDHSARLYLNSNGNKSSNCQFNFLPHHCLDHY